MNSNATPRARIVRVKVEEGRTGLFYATSPDLKGLLVAEPTLDMLYQAIPEAIVDMYKALGTQIVVTQAEDDDDDLKPWVAIPAEMARRALGSAQ